MSSAPRNFCFNRSCFCVSYGTQTKKSWNGVQPRLGMRARAINGQNYDFGNDERQATHEHPPHPTPVGRLARERTHGECSNDVKATKQTSTTAVLGFPVPRRLLGLSHCRRRFSACFHVFFCWVLLAPTRIVKHHTRRVEEMFCALSSLCVYECCCGN